MENILPKYVRPITAINDPISTVQNWEIAMDAYEEGRFRDAVIGVLNYINPSILKQVDTSADIDFVQAQGSAEVHIKITNSHFKLEAPFLKLTDATNQVALLRKVTEVNFSPLTLVQIRLHNNELWFEYEMPLSVCNPYKVYDIVRQTSVFADDYDDMFISDYKADRYKEPKITPLSNDEQEKVWKQITDIFNDYKNYAEYFKSKRWNVYVWDITIISMLKIANMPCLNGKLRTDINTHIGNMTNSNIDFEYRINKGTNYMSDLAQSRKEDILKHLYHAEQFISLRWRSSEKIVTNELGRYKKQIDDYYHKEQFFNMAYYLQFIFLKLMYDYNLEENYRNVIQSTLEKISGIEPYKSALILTKLFYEMYDGKIDPQPKKPKKKGFFSQLFN